MIIAFLATADGRFRFGETVVTCQLGRAGVIAASDKREGDLATPIGTWPIRRVFYRADRLKQPKTGLECVALTPEDGWCDDPADPMYNQRVTLPYSASHETLWRDDHAYDLICELGYNDDPVMPGRGSAIFLHLKHDDGRPTAGCVALSRDDMLAALALMQPGAELVVSR